MIVHHNRTFTADLERKTPCRGLKTFTYRASHLLPYSQQHEVGLTITITPVKDPLTICLKNNNSTILLQFLRCSFTIIIVRRMPAKYELHSLSPCHSSRLWQSLLLSLFSTLTVIFNPSPLEWLTAALVASISFNPTARENRICDSCERQGIQWKRNFWNDLPCLLCEPIKRSHLRWLRNHLANSCAIYGS